MPWDHLFGQCFLMPFLVYWILFIDFKKKTFSERWHWTQGVSPAPTLTFIDTALCLGKTWNSTSCHWFLAFLFRHRVGWLLSVPSIVGHPVELALASEAPSSKKLLSLPIARVTVGLDITKDTSVSLGTNPYWIHHMNEKKKNQTCHCANHWDIGLFVTDAKSSRPGTEC